MGDAIGLSPRVRGNLEHACSPPPAGRSIPARAGEPNGVLGGKIFDGVYPRACGGTPPTYPRLSLAQGLSPRVRGNRLIITRTMYCGGSIPARAGEPLTHTRRVFHVAVYPRACGGTAVNVIYSPLKSGLSPRVRGNHVQYAYGNGESGSIPARAGEPRTSIRFDALVEVYPRACGGTRDLYDCAR